MRATAVVGRSGRGVELRPQSGTDLMDLAQAVRRELGADRSVRVVSGSVALDTREATALLDATPAFELDWSAGARRFVRNRAAPNPDDVEQSHRLKALAVDELRPLVQDSRLADVLDDHQVRNVALMTVPGSLGACLFDEQGTGKTVSLIAAFDLLVEHNSADVLLVVAPKSMVGEWANEIAKFTDGLYKVETLEGPRRAKSRKLGSGADVFVCNYETVLSSADDLRLMCERKRTVVAVDESFNVKNPQAQRTAAVAALREWCVRAFVLCGTPAPNRPDDIVAQVNFVDYGRAFSDARLPDEPSARRAAIAQVLDRSVVFTRNLKGVVLPDLPSRTFTELNIELEPSQRAIYDMVAGELIDELSIASDAEFAARYTHFLARRASLLRTCSDPAGVDSAFTGTPAKITALDTLLAGWIAAGEKVVVWSFYRATLDLLERRYAEYGVARVDGSVNDVSARREAVRSFQQDAATRVFIGNPAAAGAGITLHTAAVSVYESMSNQAAHYLQSLDRTHRRGQTRDVEYVTLLAADTLEAREFERLKTKASQQAELLRDPEPVLFTRQMMLNELVVTLRGSHARR
ncbi:DEAD/DEAH box helicase [Microbacterium sp. 179-B 1A2 NHS]|uniref:DEAD/DEAH box helicase n=1 Tax=Microbacterium sp. 179-B 1A2 NHS TaxID=3142383 RepID=UPI0039A32BDB